VVVAATPQGRDAAVALTARLGSEAFLAESPAALARGVDRNSIDVIVVALDDLVAQSDAVRTLKRQPDPAPVLVEIGENDEVSLVTLLRAGVDGLLPAEGSSAVLRRCLTAAKDGEVVLPRSAVRHLAAEVRLSALRDDRIHPLLRELSDREREVTVLLYAGLSTAEVSARLFVTPATVRSHLHGATRRLRVRSRDDLFRLLDLA